MIKLAKKKKKIKKMEKENKFTFNIEKTAQMIVRISPKKEEKIKRENKTYAKKLKYQIDILLLVLTNMDK